MLGKMILGLIVSVLISGCLPTKPSDLKNETANTYYFEVDNSIMNVAERVHSRFEQCYVKPITNNIKATETVDLRDKGEFEIYYRSLGVGGIYIQAVFLKSISEDRTGVRVAYYSAHESTRLLVKRWVENDYPECSIHEFSDDIELGVKDLNTHDFHINADVKSAFDLISVGMTQCHDNRYDLMNLPNDIVDSVYQKESNIGYVTLANHSFTFSYLMRTLIEPDGDNGSKITIHYVDDLKPSVSVVESWFNGGSLKCE